MCGIAGVCNLFHPRIITQESIVRMMGMMRHRGPDESGVYLDDRIGLGHNRLSIIGLATGSQPIHNEDKTLWIVYNGEIFNYVELRRDLLRRGHFFYTSTDTEVIIHLFEEKGVGCLNELNGQFAFAIWNSKERELFLARDRVGIRPLHYTVCNDQLIFASEVKAIFANSDVPRRIDPIAMDQVFTFWTTLNERTAFEGICELPPGQYLHLRRGGFATHQYWSIPFSPPEDQCKGSFDDICSELVELLTDSIRIRLRSDVPVGCYLSGGLDSSGIATLVKTRFNNELRTFGIGFDDVAFDEREYQDLILSIIKTDHTSLKVGAGEIGSLFPDVVWHCEKPLLRTAPVPLFMLSRLVRESGFKVVLTGEGADEVFGGYNIFKEAKIREFWSRRPGSKLRPLLLARLYPYVFQDPRLMSMLQAFFGNGLDEVGTSFFSHHTRWRNTGRVKGFFSNELKQATGSYDAEEELRGALPEQFSRWDILTKAQYLETTIFMSNYLLSSQGDRVAMAHSIETRFPYLDYRIMDLMGRVPSRWKIFGLNEKFILKKAFQGILPEKIRRRPKHPYRAPVGSGLMADKAMPTRELLSDNMITRTGLFEAARVKMLVRKYEANRGFSEVDNMALAGVASSQILYEQFVERFPYNPAQRIDPFPIFDYRTASISTQHNEAVPS